MIALCSLNIQRGESDRHPTNIGCTNFRFTNQCQSNNAFERYQKIKWTKEDNENVIHRNFKNNPEF